MGGKPLEALALAAIGYRSLSMSPASIGPVKATLISADLAETEAFLTPLVDAHDGAHSLRAHLRDYAERSGIPI
jgi:phosphotransferase system enzyme I (PtsP)